MDHSPNQNEHLVKVVIELLNDAYATETLWAEPVGNGMYRLRNVPFFAYGYGVEDVVAAHVIGGQLIVTGCSVPGGHSTYRLFFPEPMDDERFGPLWWRLGKLGCTFERANSRLIAVDVPPESDIYAAYEALEEGEQAKRWTFEEGHCGHHLRE